MNAKGMNPIENVIGDWKQRMLDDNWEILKEQLPELMQENFQRITESVLLVAERVSVLCGDYMEKLSVVWEAKM